MRFTIAYATLLAVMLTAPIARAAAVDLSDAAILTQLEARALHADPREQCFLYTELVQGYTEKAGRQMASGQMEEASATLKLVQNFAQHIHMGLARDTKRLKNAEMMMHTATHRLGQYMRLISQDDQLVVTSTLKQLDKVNEELLAQVFSH